MIDKKVNKRKMKDIKVIRGCPRHENLRFLQKEKNVDRYSLFMFTTWILWKL